MPPDRKKNLLSDYQRHLLQDEGFSKPPPKLVPNLCNKTNFIIHYHNLRLYLELRLCLTNVDRVLSFDQLPWLKNYINFNTRQRTAAKNDFEKDFFKLMSNAVFGKFFICWFFLWLFVLMCLWIHSLHVKYLSLCFLFLCIASFIVAKISIFMFFVLMYWFIHSR